MLNIRYVVEDHGIREYLNQHGLLKQYKKAKQHIIEGRYQNVRLKKRQPKQGNVWYFRINKQYRAVGYLDTRGIFKVAEIDDHS